MISYSMSLSADGYIAGPDGSLDSPCTCATAGAVGG